MGIRLLITGRRLGVCAAFEKHIINLGSYCGITPNRLLPAVKIVIMELDVLEKNIVAAIAKCSVFTFGQVECVYRKLKSFDKTIEVLKLAVAGVRVDDEILRLINGR